MPSAGDTFVDVLQQHARRLPDTVAFTFLADGERESHRLTYGELEGRARLVAARLQQRCRPADRVLLLCSPGPDYLVGFFGCLLAGMVAVPAYPPQPNSPRQLARIPAILQNAGARAALTTADVADGVRELVERHPSVRDLHWLTVDEPDAGTPQWTPPAGIGPDTPAFLQYTSGSTSQPKAVVLTHANLLDNCLTIHDLLRLRTDDVLVCWLPLFHDMGLIGNILTPLRYALPVVLMTPADFVRRPVRWLRAISTYRATVTFAPNFAFDLCVAKTSAEERAALDLSSWRVALNGAEPINPATLPRFTAAFAAQGWRHESWTPAYGLAEATLVVTGDGAPREPTVLTVDADQLAAHRVVPVAPGTQGPTLVGLGRPRPGHDVRIVDPDTGVELAEAAIGEIWIASPSVSPGYWGAPELTAEVFGARIAGTGDGPFLRTGDLGTLLDGELVVTGRIKDLVIVRGRNHYPYDIEIAAESSDPGLRPHCSAAFTVGEPGDEAIVVVAEVRRERPDDDLPVLARAVRAGVQADTELHVATVVLIHAGSLPKTTSGKIQRRRTCAAFLAGTLSVRHVDGASPATSPARTPLDPPTLTAWLPALPALPAIPDPAGHRSEIAAHAAAHGLPLVDPSEVSVCVTIADAAAAGRAGQLAVITGDPTDPIDDERLAALVGAYRHERITAGLDPAGGGLVLAVPVEGSDAGPAGSSFARDWATGAAAGRADVAGRLQTIGVGSIAVTIDAGDGSDVDAVLDQLDAVAALGRRLARAGAVAAPRRSLRTPEPEAAPDAEPARGTVADDAPASGSDRLSRPADELPATQRVAHVERWVRRQLAAAAGRPADDLAAVTGLRAVGLDSLMIVRAMNAIQDGAGLELDLGEFYEHETVTELAAAVLDRLDATATVVATDAGSLRRRSRQLRFPLSFPQQQLWFVEQLTPGTAAYHEPATLRLRGRLDVAALDAALAAAVHRHEALRTTFTAESGAAVQVVREPGDGAAFAGLAVTDLQADPDRDTTVAQRLTEVVRRPFDLTAGPLLRAALFRLGPEHHVLCVVAHHIVVDGTSLQILFTQLGADYAALSSGSAVREPATPELQYPDFALWQRDTVTSPGMQRHLDHWREALSGAPQLLALPTDQPRPPTQRLRGTTRTWLFPAELVTRLRELGARHDATLFMTLLAAYAAVLGRHTGQDDVVIGTPTAGRTRPELRELVGMFVNVLPIRADLSGDPTTAQLLERVRRACVGAYAHQDLPLETIVDELDARRDLSHHPLLQTVFALQHAAPDDLALAGIAVEPLPIDSGASRFDISLSLHDGADGLRCSVEYNTDLFDDDTVDTLVAHYRRVLEQWADRTPATIGGLDLVTAAELETIRRHNDTSTPGAGRRLHEHVADQAVRTPDRVAVTCGDRQLTYRGLVRRAHRIAHALRARGVGAEPAVGVALDRGPDSISVLLGVLGAGATYVPLDPAHPAARRRSIVADSGCVLVISASTDDTDPTDPTGPRRLDLDTVLAGPDVGPPEVTIADDQLAYVIHTSGSTGRPKGVMISHRSLDNMVPVIEHGLAPGADATPPRVLGLASFTFDASLWDVVIALAFGGTLCLAVDDERLPGPALSALLARQGVTHATLAPTVLAALVADPGSALRVVVSTTEAITSTVVARWARGHRLVDGYGPTETTIGATLAEVDPDAAPTLGRPFANTTVHLLDRDLNHAPTGVVGELYVGGVGLARGYLRRPALTAQSFVPDPSSPVPGARLYRTGDLARRRPDGELRFCGRADGQVKIRGFRIEPGEVESVLRAHADVRDAVVVARDDPGGATRLVGYVVADPATSTSAVRAHATRTLPDYMVPATLVVLDRLPMTTTGKVDRAALPAPVVPPTEGPPDGTSGAAGPDDPATETETVLAAIWRRLLGLAHVGRDDDFFAIGGDSILSIQVAARAAEAGVSLTPTTVFRHRTLAGIAASADTAASDPGHRSPAPDGTTVAPVGPYPATPIQRWFLDQDQPAPDRFSQSFLLRADEPPDLTALSTALAALVAHHHALRTRVDPVAARGRLTIEPTGEGAVPPVRVVDVSELHGADRRDRLAAWTSEVEASHDLRSGRLVAAGYARLGPADGRLLLSVHHLAVDGVSWSVLLDDLRTAYDQALLGLAIELPAPTASFREWALDRASRTNEHELPYWTNLLAAAPPAPVAPRGPVADSVQMTRTLDASDTATLSTSSTLGPLRDVVLAAIARAWAEATGHDRVLLDVEGHGRTTDDGPDVSRTVGWFTALFPVLVPVAGTPAQLLQAVRTALGSTPDSGRGFGALRAAGALPPSPAQLCVNFLGRVDATVDAGGAWTLANDFGDVHQDPRQQRAYPVDVVAFVLDGTLRLRWTSATHPGVDAADVADRALAHLRGYAAAVGAAHDGAAVARTGGPDGIVDRYPLTSTQEGMLFHAARYPDSAAYVVQLAFTLADDTDLDVLRAAWDDVVDRHAALRTSFHRASDGRAEQRVHGHVELPWVVVDARSGDTADVDDIVAGERARGFDPARAPLARLLLIRLPGAGVRFVWTHHHLLMDGWSLPLVLGDVFDAYRARQQGRRADAPAPRDFGDYVRWLTRPRERDAALERRWRTVLDGVTAPTTLPVDPPADPRPGGAERSVVVGAEVSAQLAGYVRRHGITVGTLVQAAWAVVLARHAGTDDVVSATTVSGRPAQLSGSQTMVGLFIRTLPVRARLDPTRPVTDWLAAWQDELAELRADESLDLVEVQGWSAVPRGTAMSDSIVVVENYPLSAASARERAGITLRDVHAVEQTEAALTLVAVPGEQLTVRLLHDTMRYDAAAADRLLAQVVGVLADIALDTPGRTLGDLGLAADSSAEPAEPTATTATPVATDVLVARFARLAHERPDAVALTDADTRLTYRALAQRAAGLAVRLRAAGVGPESLVAVLLDRGVDQITAILGVHAAGGAYLPLDPDYPEARLRYVLDDSAATVLVGDPATWSRLPDDVVERLAPVAVQGAPGAAEDLLALTSTVDPRSLAYVIYTSGSTGRPKGVQVEHRQTTRLFDATEREFGFGPSDVWTQFHSVAFDFSVWELWGALAYGGRLTLVPHEIRRAPERVLVLLAEQAVTVLNQTPSAFAALDAAASAGTRRLPALRLIVFGGESLAPERLARWRAEAIAPGAQLVNMYGITETTVHVTHHRVDATATSRVGSPIGRPLDDLTATVRDDRLRALPVGAIGELYVGGAGVARGYLSRPALTAERFGPDPSASTPGARCYRTGDLARRDATGALHYLGRRDEQIKIRGHRIELGEVEAALRTVPGVGEVAVTRREDVPGREQLVAYLVPSGDDHAATVRVAREQAARELPEHERPDAYVVLDGLDGLPVTVHGKLDRAALPAPDGGRTDTAPQYVAPRSDTERRLAREWEHVLGVAPIGRTDNFFVLGGHSLLAAQLQARLRQDGVELALSALFEARDLAELAHRLDQRAGTVAEPITPSRAGGDTSEHPLSFAQQRMDFLHRWSSGTSIYHIAGTVVLDGELDRPALRTAIDTVAARHDSLRTRLVVTAGVTVQQVRPAAPVPLPTIDLRAIVDDGAEQALLHEVVRSVADTPFDLAEAAPWRVALVTPRPGRHVLALCLHHLVADGRSLELLLDEVAAEYSATVTGRGCDRTAPPLQYPDYARWQRARFDGPDPDPGLEHWRDRLATVPTTSLPTDHPRPDVQRHDGALLSVRLPETVAAGVSRLAADTSVTPFLVLLAATAVGLTQSLQLTEFVAGTPVAGRNRTGLDTMLGNLANTVVLRVPVGSADTFADVLGRARTVAADAFDHADVPFELVVRELTPTRTAGHLPLFQLWFVVQDEPDLRDAFAGLTATTLSAASELARYDLRVEFRRSRDGLELLCQYKTDLYRRSTVEALAAHLTRVLAAVVDRPAQSLHTLAEQRVADELAHRAREARDLGAYSQQALRRRDRRRVATTADGTDQL